MRQSIANMAAPAVQRIREAIRIKMRGLEVGPELRPNYPNQTQDGGTVSMRKRRQLKTWCI
jgi:hypothetical protein